MLSGGDVGLRNRRWDLDAVGEGEKMINPWLDEVRRLAIQHGWKEIDHQENIKMISFTDGPARINVYYSRMTVATVLDHPKLGRQTLYRKNVRFPQLAQIFENPRVHSRDTGLRGYHRVAHA